MYIRIPLLLLSLVVLVCISIVNFHLFIPVFFYSQSIQIFLRVFLLVLIDVAFFRKLCFVFLHTKILVRVFLCIYWYSCNDDYQVK